MPENLQGIPKIIASILLYPLFFQAAFLSYAWAEGDLFWFMVSKRVLILLPVLGIIFCCWVSVFCALSLVFRQDRRKFIEKFFLTWWDLGRAIFFYWGGLVRLVFFVIVWIFGLLQLLLVGILVCLQDIVLAPFRMLRSVGEQTVQAGTPWFAALLTVLWCVLEAAIFTYVLTPLVMDVFSNMTGEQLTETGVRVPLYFILLAFVLGSYAVLNTWVVAIKARDIGKIFQITVFESFVLIFEVLFLYREFVDALVPWFAQHAGSNFQLGIFGTLLIAGFVWMAIRAMSWFLFASGGTPTILAVIQRTGLQSKGAPSSGKGPKMELSSSLIAQVRKELNWVQEKGDEFLRAFLLPPLQIIAASINFCTLLIFSRHTFDMPLKRLVEMTDTKSILDKIDKSEND